MLLFCEYDSYFYVIYRISKWGFEHMTFFYSPNFPFFKKKFFSNFIIFISTI